MQTISLSQNLLSGLSVIIENLPPGKISSMKNLKLAMKIADKFAEATAEITKLQKEINDKVAELNKELKATETPEARKDIENKANGIILPMIANRDEAGKGVASVELSDDQVAFVKDNMKLLCDSFKTARSALEVAEAFGVDFEEEKK